MEKAFALWFSKKNSEAKLRWICLSLNYWSRESIPSPEGMDRARGAGEIKLCSFQSAHAFPTYKEFGKQNIFQSTHGVTLNQWKKMLFKNQNIPIWTILTKRQPMFLFIFFEFIDLKNIWIFCNFYNCQHHFFLCSRVLSYVISS